MLHPEAVKNEPQRSTNDDLIAALATYARGLKAALEAYAEHREDCAWHEYYPCTCGLERHLA